MQAYRAVLAHRDVRRVLVLGTVVRVPMWAGNVILTLHVVTHLHRSYGAAGLLIGVTTVAAAISSPWRGRRLDRLGLRGAIVPSLVVLGVGWAVAPFVGYWLLLAFASLANLFIVPTFSIVRQALMHAVDESERKSALSVDSVMVEISFMIGPALGVLLSTYIPTSWALFACEYSSILGGVVLWIANPALRSADADRDAADRASAQQTSARRLRIALPPWLTTVVVAVLAMSAASTVVLTGTDVSVVAALRTLHHQSWIGWELAVWGLGSALGGLVYGAIHRTVPMPVLLGLLGLATAPVAAARDPAVIAVLLLVAGFFCAPTITAAVDALPRAVPEHVRGEVLGWHGSAMTAGSAAGAPVAGVAIDAFGWRGGFVLAGLRGVVLAAFGYLALRRSTVGLVETRDEPVAVGIEAPESRAAGA